MPCEVLADPLNALIPPAIPDCHAAIAAPPSQPSAPTHGVEPATPPGGGSWLGAWRRAGTSSSSEEAAAGGGVEGSLAVPLLSGSAER